MVELTCLCGQVRLTVEKRPEFINACNCTLCAKSGARWSYQAPAEVTVEGETLGYRRGDKADPNAEIRFCGVCGSTTHFVLTPNAIEKFGNALLGVNMRLADEGDLAGVEVRYPDGKSWPGTGDFTYTRDARIIGRE